jgi:hypothetical protein
MHANDDLSIPLKLSIPFIPFHSFHSFRAHALCLKIQILFSYSFQIMLSSNTLKHETLSFYFA